MVNSTKESISHLFKKLFDKVQEVVKKRGRSHPSEPLHFPFAGFIKCGECGMTITAEQKLKYYKTINCGQQFIYYHCTKKNKSIKCHQRYITQDGLLPQLNSIIQKVSLSTADYQWFTNRMSKDYQKEQSAVSAIVQELKRELIINGLYARP